MYCTVKESPNGICGVNEKQTAVLRQGWCKAAVTSLINGQVLQLGKLTIDYNCS